MKTIRISVFLFPWEIDLLQDTVDKLKSASTYIDKNKFNIIFDVTMNVSSSAIDWSQSQLPKQFFIESFNSICNKLSYFMNVEYDIDDSATIIGCVNKRKQSICKSTDLDYIIWLDLDVHFPVHVLRVMCDALDIIQDEYFVVTPETVKMWDTSWDLITNYRYKDNHPKQRKFAGNEIFNADQHNFIDYINGSISIQRLQAFKFSGGWFNMFSAKLLKLINIPDSFGSYGLEDTFIMNICNRCCQLDYPIYQYIIRNLVVGEYHLPSHGSNFKFDTLIHNILPSKDIQREQAAKSYSYEFDKKIINIKTYFDI